MMTFSLMRQHNSEEPPEFWEPELVAQFTDIDDAVNALREMAQDCGTAIFWIADEDEVGGYFDE